jgi:DNA polymerase-3 subunit alpha
MGSFTQVHMHTEYSPMDGMPRCLEAAALAAEQGAPALAITDHGTCAGHPDHQKACQSVGIRPIFGIETYFQPDRHERPASGDKEAQDRLRGGSHLILLAMNDAGLHDLWAASTEAFATGFYYKPRMDWELLEERGQHLIATTSCLGGIISQDLLKGRHEKAFDTLDRLRSIFGDRLYLEVQANDLPEQRLLNMMLAEISKSQGIPLVAACDSHFLGEEDAALHRLWMACQTGKGNEDYWHFAPMHGEQRVFEMLAEQIGAAAAGQAIAATAEIAGRCKAEISGHAEPPVFTPGGTAQDDNQRLFELCVENFHKVPGGEEYIARLEREYEVVTSKGLAGCYLIVHDIVSWVRSRNILVGPGRGSAAGSLMSYLLGITSIDPIPAGLLFERFLTPGRAALPDFDLDFPSSKRDLIQNYVITKYGPENVVRVGTHMRYRAKSILDKLASVIGSLPLEAEADFRMVSAIIKEAESHTAGLGLPWDELLQEPALQEFITKYPTVWSVAHELVGRLRSYGQHPAGLIISPGKPLTGSMPMRRVDSKSDLMVSQWDYRAAEDQGLLKLDLLTLRTIDTLQLAVELVAERTGRMPDPRSWSIEHEDPQVYDAIGRGETVGMFQVETSLCTSYATRMSPRSLADLADLTTIIRPGPRNSGAAEKYMRRRAGQEEVSSPHPLLAGHLARSQGVMLYQEDILTAVRVLGGYDDLEADGVRRFLGKKLTSKTAAAGEEFVRRCAERGHDPEQIEALWRDIAEFGKYAFNRCLSGNVRIHLAASSQHSDGEIDLATLYRRLHAPLLPPEPSGRAATGRPKYQGPCVVCSTEEPGKRIRGACNACYVWRQKFSDPKRGLYGLSYYADGRIRPARIVDVVAQGRRETWKITLKDGRSIAATGNHQHLTPAGYRRVDELLPGDSLVIDGGYEKDHHDPARHRLTRGDRQREGAVNGAFGAGNYGFVDGGAAFWEQWKQVNPKVCVQCGTDQGRIEVAHLDGDHSNNTEGNLSWLCVSCHKAYDYAHNDRRRRWQKGHLSEAVPIESIECAGLQETYDVVMDVPHNFVANGIVTHNSHGYSYGTLSYWTAWFKVHYPVEMFTAILNTLDDKDRMAEFATDARRMGILVLPPDVRSGGAGFTFEGLSIRYGLSSIKGVGPQAISKITAGQPYTTLADFKERSGVDSGVLLALARAGALDALVHSRRGLIQLLEAERSGDAVRCVHKAEPGTGPGGLPCSYDWANEPQPPPRTGKSGRVLKVHVKPVPKRCTVACRRYTPPPELDMTQVPEYPPDALFRMEDETYGTWMTPALFEQLDRLAPGMREQARRIALMLPKVADGIYPVAAIFGGAHTARTRNGSTMWWARMITEVTSFDVAVFSPRENDEIDVPGLMRGMRPGTLVSAEVVKGTYFVAGRGWRTSWRLADIQPVRSI